MTPTTKRGGEWGEQENKRIWKTVKNAIGKQNGILIYVTLTGKPQVIPCKMFETSFYKQSKIWYSILYIRLSFALCHRCFLRQSPCVTIPSSDNHEVKSCDSRIRSCNIMQQADSDFYGEISKERMCC